MGVVHTIDSMGNELISAAHHEWLSGAVAAGINVTDFNSKATLADRLAWANARSLIPTAVWNRSTAYLADSAVPWGKNLLPIAAERGFYVAPEWIFFGPARARRRHVDDVLQPLHRLLDEGQAKVLLLNRITRLFSDSQATIEFLRQIVSRGVRVVSLCENLDTNLGGWEYLVAVYESVSQQLYARPRRASRRC